MPRHFSVCRSDYYIQIMMHIIVLRFFINFSDLDFLEDILINTVHLASNRRSSLVS